MVEPTLDDTPAGNPYADRDFNNWKCVKNMGDFIIEHELEEEGEAEEYT